MSDGLEPRRVPVEMSESDAQRCARLVHERYDTKVEIVLFRPVVGRRKEASFCVTLVTDEEFESAWEFVHGFAAGCSS